MDKRLMNRRGEVTWSWKRRDRAVGWESFNACCSSLSPGDNQSCNENVIQTTNGRLSLNQLEMLQGMIELQIIVTSWAIGSLAGGGLGKVKVEECQGEKEKNRLTSHS